MTVKYYAILTNQGAARLANATMLGSKLNLTQMAVGDANGVLPTPDPAQTKLINQKRIAPLNLLSVDPNNQSQIIAEQIIPENEGGFWIREIGLYDDEGVLIAVANCPETYKPQLQEGSGRTQTIRMILVVTNTEAITLKIDPSVVLATRKYVDDKISEHEQSRRHPDASLTAKGFTQLSSAINSESETLAATPKAVKAAYDLANGKYTAQNATTTQKGIVQLSSDTNSTSETLAATPKAVKAAYDLAAGKAPSSHTHPWNQITGVPTASLTAKGITQLSSATDSTSEVLAATPKAVKAAYDLANGKQAADATLTALAALATAADKLPYFTGVDRAALTALTSVGRAILGKTSIQSVLDYLGLEETINRAADALQKSQNGADIPDKPRFVQNIGLKETLNPTKRVSIGNIGTGVFDGSTPCINIGDSDSGFIGSADGVLDIYCNAAKVGYIDGNGLHMLTDIHFDNARMTTNGDIFGSVWGNNWLSIWITNQLNTRGTIDWINSELAVRDNNINTRATWDYVNQTFARKNTGSIQDWGWILDDSTGFIMQWGTLGNSNGTYNFPRAFPVGCFAVFVTNTNAQGTQVDNAFGYPVSNSQFFAATKSSGMANLVNNFPVAWLALGR
ncbi:phage tail protein [Salmonella enterica]|nr:phage tail protein [Salmonella enterica subsp. enterica serovar 4,[5],12:i:-]EHH9007881.1 phage tail protein [Salmonella enterica]HBJ7167944.1 phage tail protein [Salmonella enterica subsp. enterica serovar Typhimurium]EHH9018947.1 phage tail protein [Salmonella enterica]EHH9028972.1 phage tail protein [Salmonella enterica]